MAGRKTKYDENMCGKAEELAMKGLIDEEIARQLGISLSTYYKYQTENVDFTEAIKRGKSYVDNMVESALLKRALGYRYDEITQEPIFDKKTGKDKVITSKIVTKEVQPDTTAQIFWLKCRRPDRWRDKQPEDDSKNINITWNIPDNKAGEDNAN